MSKRRVESCLILAAPVTRRAPQFLRHSSGVWRWPKYHFTLAYRFIYLSKSRARLHFPEQTIELEATSPARGGVRWWYCCPHCQRRAARLYLPRNEQLFWCRLCYDLSYESVQASRAKYYRLFKAYGLPSRVVREHVRLIFGGSLVVDLVGYPAEL